MIKQYSNYKLLVPDSLQLQADQLLDYLMYYPYDVPSECPYCHSRAFKRCGYSRTALICYKCQYCHHKFTQLTGTIFNFSTKLSLWGELGKLYLMGLATKEIMSQLSISRQTVIRYRNKINTVMKQQYPQLFQWWDSHQQREDMTYTAEVEKQVIIFKDWLYNLIYEENYICEHCHTPFRKIKSNALAAYFICQTCHTYFNPLKNTHFHGLLYKELWLSYTEKLIAGHSDRDMRRLFKITVQTSKHWRQLFIEQMQDLELYDLIQWLQWQRQRRYVEMAFDIKLYHSEKSHYISE